MSVKRNYSPELVSIKELYKAGKYAEALECMRAIYPRNKNEFEINYLCAVLLMQNALWEEAEEIAERARKINPNILNIYHALFGIYAYLRKIEKEKSCLDIIVGTKPKDKKTIQCLLEYSKDSGNITDVKKYLRALDDFGEPSTQTLTYCAFVLPEILSEQDVDKLLGASTSQSQNERALAAFGLAYVSLWKREYEKAEKYFDLANEAEGQNKFVNSEVERRTQFWISNPVPKHRYHPLDTGQQGPEDIILIGASRSGKSILEGALASLCDARGLGEARVFSHFITRRVGSRGSDIRKYINGATDHQVRSDAADLDKKLAELAKKLRLHTFPGNLFGLPLISIWKPNAPIIFVRRQIYDHAISIYTKRYAAGNEAFFSLEGIVRYIYRYNKFTQFLSEHIPNPHIHMEYEDFVNAPKPTLQRALTILGNPNVHWDQFERKFLSEHAESPGVLPPGTVDSATKITSEYQNLDRLFPRYKEKIDVALKELREEGADMTVLRF